MQLFNKDILLKSEPTHMLKSLFSNLATSHRSSSGLLNTDVDRDSPIPLRNRSFEDELRPIRTLTPQELHEIFHVEEEDDEDEDEEIIFFEQPPPQYHCFLCFSVLKSPIRLPCNHIFCLKCYAFALEKVSFYICFL